MIHFMIVCTIVWLTYKTITRGYPDDATVAAIGTMLGLFFGLVSGLSFLVGGWWSVVGYGLLLFTLTSWLHARATRPYDIETALAEYEAMKPELDEMRAYSESVLNPKMLKLPG